jgi:hypothetical protein
MVLALGSGGLDGRGSDVHAAAFAVELDLAIDEGEQGPVASGADIVARDEFGAALADDDAARGDMFAAEAFYAEAFAITITAVSATALAFLMCHTRLNSLKFDFFDFQDRLLLAVADGAMIAFAAFHLKRDDFWSALMFYYIGGNGSILNYGCADGYFAVAAHEEDTGEAMLLASFGINAVHDQCVSRAHAVFFTSRFNNSVHKTPYRKGAK